MLLSVLLQAAAGVGISKLGAAIGAGIAVLGYCCCFGRRCCPYRHCGLLVDIVLVKKCSLWDY